MLLATALSNMGVYFADACTQHWPNILNIEIGGAGARTLSMYRGWAFFIQTAVATKGVLRPMAPRIFYPYRIWRDPPWPSPVRKPRVCFGSPSKERPRREITVYQILGRISAQLGADLQKVLLFSREQLENN